jgi:hypothetical protein
MKRIDLKIFLYYFIFAFLYSCTVEDNNKPKSLTYEQKIKKIDRLVEEVDRRKYEFKQIDMSDGSNETARWKSVAYKFGEELKLVEEVFIVNGIQYINKYYFEVGYLHYIKINREVENKSEQRDYYFWVNDILKAKKDGNDIQVLGTKKDELILQFQEKEIEIKNMLKTSEYLPELKFRPQDFFYE